MLEGDWRYLAYYIKVVMGYGEVIFPIVIGYVFIIVLFLFFIFFVFVFLVFLVSLYIFFYLKSYSS